MFICLLCGILYVFVSYVVSFHPRFLMNKNVSSTLQNYTPTHTYHSSNSNKLNVFYLTSGADLYSAHQSVKYSIAKLQKMTRNTSASQVVEVISGGKCTVKYFYFTPTLIVWCADSQSFVCIVINLHVLNFVNLKVLT